MLRRPTVPGSDIGPGPHVEHGCLLRLEDPRRRMVDVAEQGTPERARLPGSITLQTAVESSGPSSLCPQRSVLERVLLQPRSAEKGPWDGGIYAGFYGPSWACYKRFIPSWGFWPREGPGNQGGGARVRTGAKPGRVVLSSHHRLSWRGPRRICRE